MKKKHASPVSAGVGLLGPRVIRLHELIWLKIDDFGFATLKRKSEIAKSKDCEITIPKPVRTQGELDALLATLLP